MKNTVISDAYPEVDLRPYDLLNKYAELAERDVETFLVRGRSLTACACPACSEENAYPSFSKFGLHYRECARCRTLYVSPRPGDEALDIYQSRSAARRYWMEEYARKTRNKRREKIVKPRIQWILDSTMEYLPSASHFVDVNTNQYDYIEELMRTDLFRRKTLIHPLFPMDRLKLSLGIDIYSGSLWEADLGEGADVVALFEVADRTADVEALFAKTRQLLKKNGLCFMTAVLSSGFDIQMLGPQAPTLFPPDRLNVFSIEGLNALFARNGFECLELSTPGVFDVEVVQKAIESDPLQRLPKFIDYLLKNRSREICDSFQKFLQDSLLSSYGRIVLRKR